MRRHNGSPISVTSDLGSDGSVALIPPNTPNPRSSNHTSKCGDFICLLGAEHPFSVIIFYLFFIPVATPPPPPQGAKNYRGGYGILLLKTKG